MMMFEPVFGSMGNEGFGADRLPRHQRRCVRLFVHNKLALHTVPGSQSSILAVSFLHGLDPIKSFFKQNTQITQHTQRLAGELRSDALHMDHVCA